MHQVGLDADVKTPLLDRRKATNKDGKPDSTPQNEDRPSGGEDAFHIRKSLSHLIRYQA